MSNSISFDVPVPMRDGTKLSTNVWRPESEGPVPALLCRSPYGLKELIDRTGPSPNILAMLGRGMRW
jgi:predicted acyl esterase